MIMFSVKRLGFISDGSEISPNVNKECFYKILLKLLTTNIPLVCCFKINVNPFCNMKVIKSLFSLYECELNFRESNYGQRFKDVKKYYTFLSFY